MVVFFFGNACSGRELIRFPCRSLIPNAIATDVNIPLVCSISPPSLFAHGRILVISDQKESPLIGCGKQNDLLILSRFLIPQNQWKEVMMVVLMKDSVQVEEQNDIDQRHSRV